MMRLYTRKILAVVVALFGASILSFGLLYIVPGDPAVGLAGVGASTETVEAIRAELGLDRALVPHYLDWLASAFQGDLGTSFSSGRAVSERIMSTLPITLQIVGASLGLSIIAGSALGIASAAKPNSALDRLILAVTTVGVAIPNFWLGMILIVAVAIPTAFIPTIGFAFIGDGLGTYLSHLLLPAITLSTLGIAEVARQLRGSMIETQAAEHVRVARALGLSRSQILRSHVLKNASMPVLTVTGLLVNRLVGSTVIIEAVFNIPGAGNLLVSAAADRDIPVLQGLILSLTVVVLLTNLIVDALYTKVDPRVSYA